MVPATMLWVYVVLGAAVSVVVMLAIANVVKTWSVAALTAPFVLTTWLLLLATYGFSGLAGAALPPAGVVMPFDAAAADQAQRRCVRRGGLHEHLAGVPQGARSAALLLLAGLAVSSLAAAGSPSPARSSPSSRRMRSALRATSSPAACWASARC